MSATAPAIATPTPADPVQRWLERRAATNRANAQHSTGPRTESGKQRSSRNALRHGLTAASPVLPSEDPAAYERRSWLRFFKRAGGTLRPTHHPP